MPATNLSTLIKIFETAKKSQNPDYNKPSSAIKSTKEYGDSLKALSDLKASLDDIERLYTKKENRQLIEQSLGPIQGRTPEFLQEVLQSYGAEGSGPLSKDVAKSKAIIRQKLQAPINKIRKEVTGASAVLKEIQTQIEPLLPKMKDDVETFHLKTKNSQYGIYNNVKNIMNNLKTIDPGYLKYIPPNLSNFVKEVDSMDPEYRDIYFKQTLGK